MPTEISRTRILAASLLLWPLRSVYGIIYGVIIVLLRDDAWTGIIRRHGHGCAASPRSLTPWDRRAPRALRLPRPFCPSLDTEWVCRLRG
jgi:hypothetical protein